MAKKKCVKGWGCGNSCISRVRKCRSNLSDEGKKIVETFMQYVQRTQEPGDLADEPKPKKKFGKIENPELLEPSKPEKEFSKGLKPFGETETYKNNKENRKNRLIEELGSEELYNQVSERISQIFDESGYEPVVYMSGHVLNLIADAPPGEQRLKNQFETGSSGGALNEASRRTVEDFSLGFKSGFDLDPNGVPKDDIETHPQGGELIKGPEDPLASRDRPIYTGFQPGDKARFNTYGQYGNVAVKIKGLKPGDYTITGNDSLNSFSKSRAFSTPDKISAQTRKNFDIASMNTDLVDQPGQLKELAGFHGGDPDAIAKSMIDDAWEGGGYFEAQIMREITPDMMEIIDNKSIHKLSDKAKTLFNTEDSTFVKQGFEVNPKFGIDEDELTAISDFAVKLTPEMTSEKIEDLAKSWGVVMEIITDTGDEDLDDILASLDDS